ncbi:SANT/Myb_domain [Hexamita inflata]|uniref:SANT/Myb domain n=1 Tax=Hexamita inflata TaxID=28002 RepID=A0AA86NEL2_9EUKA|nr:SANT/Myb domain [Hexamita inflata]
MIFNTNEFVCVSLPVLQSFNYSFTGQETQQMSYSSDFILKIDKLNDSEYQEFWHTLSQIYQCEVDEIYSLYSKQKENMLQKHILSPKNTSNSDDNQIAKYRIKTPKATKISNMIKIQVQNALITVLNASGVKVEASISDQDLCLLVNEAVLQDQEQQFWNNVARLVPSKTKKQIYDFYHNSFSKALYQNNITAEDKKLIEQLNDQNPDSKPAVLADIFLQKTEKKILKRNIVMQFVNLRRNNPHK